MKLVKLLGLTAVTAMGMMAFLGAGTASATVLCTTTDTPSCTMAYGVGTEIEMSSKSGGSARLTGSGGEILATCSRTRINLNVVKAAAGVVVAVINLIQALECSQTTDTVANGELEIEYISGTHNGTVRGRNSQVTVNIFGVSCTYGTGTGTHLGTLTGGEAPILAISTTVTKTAGGFLCPGTAGWDSEYVITAPHAVFVTES